MLSLDIESIYIIHTLQKAGFDAFIVGGAVRDLLLSAKSPHTKVTDYDFTTNAKPEEIEALFPDSFYENTFGTVSITRTHLREQLPQTLNLPTTQVIPATTDTKIIDLHSASKIHDSLQNAMPEKKEQLKTKDLFEITTYRSDGAYTNHRHPDAVTWGQSLGEDLERRDFTINALALSIPKESVNKILSQANLPELVSLSDTEYEVIDHCDGLKDLSEGIIKTVGNPNKRFTEDGLRILRALRFSVQLNMQIEEATYQAIEKHVHLLGHISAERVRDEFLKMLASEYPREAIELLDASGCLHHILPELLDGKGVTQGGHHTSDVWEHSLSALDHCPSTDPIVRLATLLHDIGKPATYSLIQGEPTFYNHEIVGSRMAKKIAKRLKLSKQQTERIFILVRYHMFYYQPENTDASIRRFMRKVGLGNIDDILDLREGDRLGSGAKKTSWRLEEMKQRMVEQLHQPLEIRDLAINGHDLMEQLDMKPGPELGTVLQHLFEQVLENPELNTKDQLLKLAQEIQASFH